MSDYSMSSSMTHAMYDLSTTYPPVADSLSSARAADKLRLDAKMSTQRWIFSCTRATS